MKTISKEHVGVIQLRAAIKLYNEKDYVSSITLAGAAEEILGQLAKEKTHTNSLELDSFMFRVVFPKYEYQKERNTLRNELKHRLKGSNEIKFNNFKKSATTHIAGAITNYKLFKGSLPQEEIVLAFCKQVGLS